MPVVVSHPAPPGTRSIEAALGWSDPRVLKECFEREGIRCWLDVEQVGQVSLAIISQSPNPFSNDARIA